MWECNHLGTPRSFCIEKQLLAELSQTSKSWKVINYGCFQLPKSRDSLFTMIAKWNRFLLHVAQQINFNPISLSKNQVMSHLWRTPYLNLFWGPTLPWFSTNIVSFISPFVEPFSHPTIKCGWLKSLIIISFPFYVITLSYNPCLPQSSIFYNSQKNYFLQNIISLQNFLINIPISSFRILSCHLEFYLQLCNGK